MAKVYGNTSALTKGELKDVLRIYRRKIPNNEILTLELARTISSISFNLGKKITILADRSGKIQFVFIGSPSEFPYQKLLRRRREANYRLRGLRAITTSLKSDNFNNEDLVTLANERLDLIAQIIVNKNGSPGKFLYANLIPPGSDNKWEIHKFNDLGALKLNFDYEMQSLESQIQKTYYKNGGEDEREGVILVGFDTRNKFTAENSLDELRSLAVSANKVILDELVQIRRNIDPRYLVGKGKLKEIILHAKHYGADTIIFDTELTPAQANNISEESDLNVIDRSQLIIEIFAKHAKTNEGKIQVRLADLKYNLPRLRGRGIELSQLGGGIGTRGPGEKKLEQERRTYRKQIDQLEKQIDALSRRRKHTRKNRMNSGILTVSLIGYTNVGKSTLFNSITKSDVISQNKLFSTLNPTTRKLMLPGGYNVLITDTVGFISKLPDELVNAFRATLEEIGEADLLLHIADASDELVGERIDSVNEIINSMGYEDIPCLVIFNKSDKASSGTVKHLISSYNSAVISAIDNTDRKKVISLIDEFITENLQIVPQENNFTEKKINVAS